MSSARLVARRSAVVSATVPLGIVGVAVLLGATSSVSVQGTVAMALCNLVIVLGLQVFIGNSGIYSFGQIAFAAVGAYVGALLTLPVAFASLQTPALPNFIANAQASPIVATLVAATACALLAAVVGLPMMRTSTLAIPISTFAFLIVVYNVLANWDAVTGGSAGLVSIPTTTSVAVAGIAAALAVAIALLYKSSAGGYRLRASREDEVAARAIGVSVTRERLLAFGVSGMLCGAGGTLAVHQSGVLTPTDFYFGATVATLTMLVLGGSRSVLGAVVGTIAVTAIDELLHGIENGVDLFGLVSVGETPGLAAIGLGAILLATMIARPDGLSGGREAGELGHFQQRDSRTSEVRHCGSPKARRAQRGGSLRANGVSVAFAGIEALRSVELELMRGEILGLIGPNGAGKTTLINVLSGFQMPDSGGVVLEGEDLTGTSPAQRARFGLARTFQSVLPFPHLTALESVAVGAMGVGASRRRAGKVAGDILARLGLGDQAESESRALPPGRQRLLGIARALATSPRYLLLDEPAAGLNERESEHLVEILRGIEVDFGCGLLLVEHDMNVVMSACRRVQVLEDGVTLRVGSPEAIQADQSVVEAYLGSSFPAATHA